MTNFFDQFDAPSSSKATAKPAGNFFDQFDAPSQSNTTTQAPSREMADAKAGAAEGNDDSTGGMVDNVVRSIANGITFGLSDEAAAGLDALTQGLLGRGSDAATLGQRYDENLAKERAHDKAFAAKHPYIDAAGNIVGGIATLPFIPGAAFATIPKALATGAALGAAQGFGEGEGGIGPRIGSAVTGGAVGGALGAGGALVGKAAGRLLGRTVTDTSPEAKAMADRQTLAGEFDVPLTKGQQLATKKAVTAEDLMRRGAKGPGAEAAFANFDKTQLEALQGAKGLRGTGLTPENIGDALGEKYNAARDAAIASTNEAYAKAFDPDALAKAGVPETAPADVVGGLKGSVRDALSDPEAYGGDITQVLDLTPRTQKALSLIDRLADDAAAKPVGWKRIDALRKTINGLKPQPGTEDAIGLRRVVNAFDDQIGKANPLLNDARKSHAARVQLFDKQSTNVAGASPFLKAMANADNPGQLIYNKLFGGRAIAKGEAEPLIDQLKTIYGGEGSDGVQMLKEGAVRRLLVDKDGLPLSPTRMSSNIEKALQGDAAPVYQSLFADDPDQLAKLGRYGELAKQIGETTQARNPSGTGYLMQAAKGAAHHAGTTALSVGGGLSGGIPGAVGGALVGAATDKVIDKAANKLAARAAQRAVGAGVLPLPRRIDPAIVGSIGKGLSPIQRAILGMPSSRPIYYDAAGQPHYLD